MQINSIFLNHLIQIEDNDCAPTCLKFVAKWYGFEIDIETARAYCELTLKGTSVANLMKAIEKLGLDSLCVMIDIDKLVKTVKNRPCILYWNNGHFFVLYNYRKKIFSSKEKFYISDPAIGRRILDRDKLLDSWLSGREKGICIIAIKKRN